MESVVEVRWREVRSAVCSCLPGGRMLVWKRGGGGDSGRGRGTNSRERSCSVRWSTAARAWREIASTSISAGVAVRCGVGVSGVGWGAQDAGASRGCCGRV